MADIFKTVEEIIAAKKERSAWGKGVKNYAVDIVGDLAEAVEGGWIDMDDLRSPKLLERAMLNGAADWSQYSWGGSALIYNGDIARALCNPTELKITRDGQRKPNAREEWLDVQARALYQAAIRVKEAFAEAFRREA